MLSEIILIGNSYKIVFSNQVYEFTDRVFFKKEIFISYFTKI